MTDSRNPSPSDELLGKARGHVVGDGSNPGDFVPRSPVDSYTPEGVDGATDSQDDPGASASSTPLSAEDIAVELLEAQQLRAPDPEPDASAYEESAAKLPSWAVGPSAPPRAADHLEAVRSDVVVEAPDAESNAESVEDRWTTPTAEWEVYQAERAARQKPPSRLQVPRFSLPSARALAFLIGLAFFGFGFLINQFDGKEAIADAEVGDCFIAGSELEINQVPVVDCSKKHDAELFAKVSMVGLGSTYPDEDMMFDWLYVECVDRFPGYVGEPYESSSYWVDMFIPTADGWDDGDYTGLCAIVVVDEDLDVMTTTGSARGSANNA